MGTAGDAASLRASGFFVLRTPLLPFDELRAWCEGLEAPGAFAADGARREPALSADRALLIDRVRAAGGGRSAEAPEPDAALQCAEESPSSDGATKAFRSLVAYLNRMAARSTPFGLLAERSPPAWWMRTPGWSCHPELSISDIRAWTLDYLTALVDALEADPKVRAALRFWPNTRLPGGRAAALRGVAPRRGWTDASPGGD